LSHDPVLNQILTEGTDRTSTEISGRVRVFRQKFPNDDGSTYVIAAISGIDRTVCGTIDESNELEEGKWYKFYGKWTMHQRFGWQFRFDLFLPDAPTSRIDTVDFLAKECPGIGKAKANLIVDKFGADAVRILADRPLAAFEAGIVSESISRAASEVLAGLCDPETRDRTLQLFALFKGKGFPGKLTKQCLERFGLKAPDRIRRDPFTLLVNRMGGCGFARCDRLYSDLGLPQKRLKRQGLAAWHAVREAREREGSTWISYRDAVSAVRARIGGTCPRPVRAIATMCRAGWMLARVSADGSVWIAERDAAQAEESLAVQLRRLRQGRSEGGGLLWPLDFDGLSDHQGEAILGPFMNSPVVALVGSPGTGKTHTAAAVIRAWVAEHGIGSIAVAAPTGKAAVRISEKLDEAKIGVPASTIHRLLGVKQGRHGWEFSYGPKCPVPCRLLVVDEVSMLGTDLANTLFSALATGTHVLLVGDPGQLPPVPHGSPLRDLLLAGLPTAKLVEVRRNSGAIVESCAAMTRGERLQAVPDLGRASETANLVMLPAEGADRRGEQLTRAINWLDENGFDLRDDVQVLCARNETRKLINVDLQKRVNGTAPVALGKFRVADKVIILSNSFFSSARPGATSKDREYIANGDQGIVVEASGQRLKVEFKNPKRLAWIPVSKAAAATEAEEDLIGGGEGTDEADSKPAGSIDLAYVVTTHKAQGSEWPAVIVLLEGGPLGCSREWLYTAISRAKKLCIVIGHGLDAIKACESPTLFKRRTFLVEQLEGWNK
jgi:exodeoxyribonuclease V alpha subunit